jgi:hypothetical protein
MQARAPNVGNFARQFPMADQLLGSQGTPSPSVEVALKMAGKHSH